MLGLKLHNTLLGDKMSDSEIKATNESVDSSKKTIEKKEKWKQYASQFTDADLEKILII